MHLFLCTRYSHFLPFYFKALLNLPASAVVAMTAAVNTPTPKAFTAATEMAYSVTGFKPSTVNLIEEPDWLLTV